MDFIAANSELFITIGLIISVLILGLVLLPFLQRKKYITIEGVKISQELMTIIKLILAEANFKDTKIKEQSMTILNIVTNVLKYIDEEMAIADIEQKKKIAYGLVVVALEDLKIEVSDNRKLLIELTINEVIGQLS